MSWAARFAPPAFVLLTSVSAWAADLPTQKAPPAPIAPPPALSTWQFDVTLYGWASSIAGATGFGTLPTTDYYAPFSKLLPHLQAGLMGSFIARNDTYILGVDAIWSRLGGGSTIHTRSGAPTGGQVDVTLTEGVVTAFGGLKAPIGIPNLDLYGTVGVRYYNSGTKLTIADIYGIGTTQSVNKGWTMPVAGFAGQYRFTDQWFMNGQADIGGWSDSATGQALASVGYKWTPNISTTLGYRVLYTYDKQDTGVSPITLQSRSFRYQQWMYGPFAGLKFTF
jgi:hypothetical protein